MKQSLALNLKPNSIKDIIGQDHLINSKTGIIFKMIEKKFPTSLIFYGQPGVGKSSLATALAHDLNFKFKIFNAALDKKQTLEQIITVASQTEPLILILEEIHRMNKDKQDILLEAVENGQIIMFACTTENPYFVVNPALRSRAKILNLEPISQTQMIQGLKKLINQSKINLTLHSNHLKLISQISNGDLRIALNLIDLLINLYSDQKITTDLIQTLAPNSNILQDKTGDEHFDLLSAFQKSIRGSDVDAALHYLVRLLIGGDFQALTRRMLIISYEDIGLANPTIPVKVKQAVDTFFQVGMPEGLIPLGLVVVEMALSEKSNSAYLATFKAYDDVKKYGKAFRVPKHLRDSHYLGSKHFGHGLNYQYPHDFNSHYVKQQYLPDELKDVKYYQPQLHNLYENKVFQTYKKFTNQ